METNRPVTSRRLRRHAAVVAGIGAAAAMALGTAGAAHAANPTTGTGVATLVQPGTRTLTITDANGTTLTPASTLSAAAGAGTPFGVKVADANEGISGFEVVASMSKMYLWDGKGNAAGDYTCGTNIPSSKVAVGVPAASTIESGVSSALNPVFALTGTLTNLVSGTTSPLATLATTQLNAALGLTGNSQLDTVVSSVPTGTIASPSTASNLLGTVQGIVNGALGSLPLQATSGAGGSFTNPDLSPAAACGADDATVGTGSGQTPASQKPLMVGTASVAGLLAQVAGALNNLLGTTGVATTGVPVSTLINQGVLAPVDVANALSAGGLIVNTANQAVTNIPGSSLITDLGGTTPGSTFEQIVGQLTATLVDTASSITSPVLAALNPVLTGNYQNSPQLTVTPPAGQAAGTYRGQLNVTLLQLPASGTLEVPTQVLPTLNP